MNWVIALLALWEAGDIVAPFTLGVGRVQAFVWNHLTVGIILVVVGAWAGMTSLELPRFSREFTTC